MVQNYSKNQVRYMHILLVKHKIELSFNIEEKDSGLVDSFPMLITFNKIQLK